ncbi:MAG: hypothetical protein J0I28_01530 [Caulobacterales bacterium]|nr:hypothetical protein [Caulobacterales bacterium]
MTECGPSILSDSISPYAFPPDEGAALSLGSAELARIRCEIGCATQAFIRRLAGEGLLDETARLETLLDAGEGVWVYGADKALLRFWPRFPGMAPPHVVIRMRPHGEFQGLALRAFDASGSLMFCSRLGVDAPLNLEPEWAACEQAGPRQREPPAPPWNGLRSNPNVTPALPRGVKREGAA